MGKTVSHPERRKRREKNFAKIFFNSLLEDYIAVQKRYQDRLNGYLAPCPFLNLYFNQLNEKWKDFCNRVQNNPKKILKLNHLALKNKVDEYIANEGQIAWMLYTINILEIAHKYKKYNAGFLQKLYKEGKTPVEAVTAALKKIPVWGKFFRWVNRIMVIISVKYYKYRYAHN